MAFPHIVHMAVQYRLWAVQYRLEGGAVPSGTEWFTECFWHSLSDKTAIAVQYRGFTECLPSVQALGPDGYAQ